MEGEAFHALVQADSRGGQLGNSILRGLHALHGNLRIIMPLFSLNSAEVRPGFPAFRERLAEVGYIQNVPAETPDFRVLLRKCAEPSQFHTLYTSWLKQCPDGVRTEQARGLELIDVMLEIALDRGLTRR